MDPSEIGAALVGVRWRKATKKQRAAEGQRLAEARRKALTPEQRSEIARKAVLARWAKRKGKKETSPEGSRERSPGKSDLKKGEFPISKIGK